MIKIEEATIGKLETLSAMATQLWGERGGESYEALFRELLDKNNVKLWIAQMQEESVGFIYLSLRQDYVEGSHSSPVAYIEGIYVKPSYRRRGIAAGLIKIGEDWARSSGCSEIGSDCTLDNELSRAFHKKTGFREAGRILCLIKDLA